MVKIGVALSGCDIGAVGAYYALRELEDSGVEIHALSACCMPSYAALLYAMGTEREDYENRSGAFLEEVRNDTKAAITNLSNGITMDTPTRIPVTVSAVNVTDGKAVAFTNDFSVQTANLAVFALENVHDALCSTISLMDGRDIYPYKNLRLCDYCAWYGCPYFPLKMAGVQKIISLTFLPKHPVTPYEVLVRQMIAGSALEADIHIPIEFDGNSAGLDEYSEITVNKIKGCIDKIYWKTLF